MFPEVLMRFFAAVMMFFILLIPCAGQDNPAAPNPEPDPYTGRWVLMNPDSRENPLMWNFNRTLSGPDIYNTARARRLFMSEDQEPVVDDRAVFLSYPESRVEITGLKPNLDLVLYIDLVRFKGKKENFPVTRLDIFIESSLSREKVASLIPADIPENGSIDISLPHQTTFSGSFRLIFKELSREKDFWGFWDFIIADRKIDIRSLPLNKPVTPPAIPDNMKIVE